MVIPTLVAGDALTECLASLSCQTLEYFQIIVVDNSGKGLVKLVGSPNTTVIDMGYNSGFGAAINAGASRSDSPYVATLNDDAVAHPQWLASLVNAMDEDSGLGSCASQVRFYGQESLDSAGMLLCADGSSKQRGHGLPYTEFSRAEPVLMPSASAALYRRSMLDQAGGFDADFFLYCEDTDLGLRAARLGWRCLFVPEAVVEHRYSHSAGRVSPLKAYYVERNRIFLAIKNLPLRMLLVVPFVAAVRYFWHLISILQGEGKAAEFQQQGNGGWRLALFVLKAHLAVGAKLWHLWSQRRRIFRQSKLSDGDFTALLRRHSISARKVAEL